jgi:hypothetical protein
MELALAQWRLVLHHDQSCMASIGHRQVGEKCFRSDFVLRLFLFVVDRQPKHQLVVSSKSQDDTVQVRRLRCQVDGEGSPRMVEATLNDMGERIRRFGLPRRFGNQFSGHIIHRIVAIDPRLCVETASISKHSEST